MGVYKFGFLCLVDLITRDSGLAFVLPLSTFVVVLGLWGLA